MAPSLAAANTNHIQQLTPGTGCYAFFLTAQGRILADVNVLCRQDSFFSIPSRKHCTKLVEHLEKFIIADDVMLEDLTPHSRPSPSKDQSQPISYLAQGFLHLRSAKQPTWSGARLWWQD